MGHGGFRGCSRAPHGLPPYLRLGSKGFVCSLLRLVPLLQAAPQLAGHTLQHGHTAGHQSLHLLLLQGKTAPRGGPERRPAPGWPRAATCQLPHPRPQASVAQAWAQELLPAASRQAPAASSCPRPQKNPRALAICAMKGQIWGSQPGCVRSPPVPGLPDPPAGSAGRAPRGCVAGGPAWPRCPGERTRTWVLRTCQHRWHRAREVPS